MRNTYIKKFNIDQEARDFIERNDFTIDIVQVFKINDNTYIVYESFSEYF